jgi:HD superfamily phosphodiesterase
MPPRLLAHLTIVYEIAKDILAWIKESYPEIRVNQKEVLFGAIIHDIGKVIAIKEIHHSGSTHESVGFELLTNTYGIDPKTARFTYTHSDWFNKDATIEDWIVSLADKVWKGKRIESLEDLIVQQICKQTNREKWEIFINLDEFLQTITRDAHQRILMQDSQKISLLGDKTYKNKHN